MKKEDLITLVIELAKDVIVYTGGYKPFCRCGQCRRLRKVQKEFKVKMGEPSD